LFKMHNVFILLLVFNGLIRLLKKSFNAIYF